MKATGIVRRIDDLGRVVIPKEIRRSLSIKEGDPLELFVDGKAICFVKYSPMVDYNAELTAALKGLQLFGINGAVYDNSDNKILGDRGAPMKQEYDPFNVNHYPIKIDDLHWGYFAPSRKLNDEEKKMLQLALKIFVFKVTA